VYDLLYVILPAEFGTAEWLALVELAVKQYQQAQSVWQARQEAKLHAAIEQDLDNARKIQLSLVPRSISIPGMEVAVDYQPSRFVGGDYVDVVPMRDGRTLLVSADVSGKGLPAALVTLSLHSIVHTSLRSGMSLVDMMVILNEHLLQYLEPESFVTMTCVGLSLDSGAMEVVNAGHLPPFIVAPDGGVRELQSGAHMPLGLDDADAFVAQHERLQRGEMLGLFSDGLTEIALPDGRLVGLEGLAAKLSKLYKSHRNRGIEELADRLNEWLNDLEADHARRDDRSFLLVRLNG
jgi:serine phosphatase RsbU (regulator of sigma subunit)